MAFNKPLKQTIYIGTFIHSLTLDTIEVVQFGIIGVDEKGVIAFVEKDCTIVEWKEIVKSRHGWEEWETVKIGDGTSTTFLFPGFVGKVKSSPSASLPWSMSLLYSFAILRPEITITRIGAVHKHQQ